MINVSSLAWCRWALLLVASAAGCASFHGDPAGERLPAASEATFDAARARVEPGGVLPLRDGNARAVLVQGSVNANAPAWFILDTGAGASSIEPRTARKHGLTPIASVLMNQSVKTAVYAADRLEAGPLTIESPRFVALNMAMPESVFGARVEGILGREIFAAGVWEIDVGAGRCTFLGEDAPGVSAWMPVEFINNLPHVRCRFPGGEGLVVIDTGYGGSVLFTGGARPEL